MWGLTSLDVPSLIDSLPNRIKETLFSGSPLRLQTRPFPKSQGLPVGFLESTFVRSPFPLQPFRSYFYQMVFYHLVLRFCPWFLCSTLTLSSIYLAQVLLVVPPLRPLVHKGSLSREVCLSLYSVGGRRGLRLQHEGQVGIRPVTVWPQIFHVGLLNSLLQYYRLKVQSNRSATTEEQTGL